MADTENGRLVDIGDTRIYVVERGEGLPIFVLHGGPGLDHHMFADYLDALTDKYQLVLVDQRSHGLSDKAPEDTWSLEQMALDVKLLAEAMGFDCYVVLGHSYGAFVALQNAADWPGAASATIVSSGLPSARYLAQVDVNLAAFEPLELRQQVTDSWARERDVQTQEDCESSLRDQLPFHFGDPLDPRIAEYAERSSGQIHAPDVLRYFAVAEYGGIEVEDKLAFIPQPVLVLAGRNDRTCVLPGNEAIAAGIPDAELVVFDHSGHMTFVEENEKYIQAVRDFLDKKLGV